MPAETRVSDERSFRLPTGAVAALVFVASVLALVILLPGGGPDVGTLLGDPTIAEVHQRVASRLDDVPDQRYRRVRVRGQRVEWRDGEGRPFLATPTVTFAVVLGEPGDGVLIRDGVITSPEVRLVETAPGEWNYERPLAPFLADDARGTNGDGGMAVTLRDLALRDGHVVLDMQRATYEARSLDASLASARLTGPGVEAPVFRIDSAAATLVLPDTGEARVTRPVTVAEATLRIVDGAVEFQVPRATFGGSTLADAEGVWNPALGGLGLDASLTATRARVADLPWLRAEVPEEATGSFRLGLEPRPDDRTAVTLTQLDLQAPGSSASGSVRAIIGGESPVLETIDVRVDPLSLDLVEAFTGPLPYSGQVRGRIQGSGGDVRFDLQGELAASPGAETFASDLTGRIRMTESGVALETASVQLDRVPLSALRAVAPGLPLQGTVTGTVQLDGAPGEAPISLDVRLEAGGGVVTARGTADLTGPEPAYDLTGELQGVNVRQVIAPSVPPVQLFATFDLEGRGTDPATAEASVVAHGAFTGWQSEPGDTLVVDADVSAGELAVETLRLELGPVQLGATGRWRFAGGEGGAVRYDLAVESLTPLGPYLPAPGAPPEAPTLSRGRIEAEGTLAGTLDEPVLSGELTASELRHGPWAAESFQATYDLDLTAGALPEVQARASGAELRTPYGDLATADLELTFRQPRFDVSFRGDQSGGRGILALEAEGRIEEEGGREVLVRTAEVDLEQQRWRLPSPARITWQGGGAVRVEDLTLRQVDGEGLFEVAGVVAPADSMDLDLRVADLPVGQVLALAGSDLQLSGALMLDASITGPAASPSVNGHVSLSEGSVRGVAVRSMESTLDYQDGALQIEARGAIGDSALVGLNGTIPARIRLAGDTLFRLTDGEAMNVRIVTRTFPLSTLDPGISTVRELAGRLQADVRIAGSPDEPRLSGSARVIEGAFTVPLVDRRFHGVSGTIDLSGREARLRELTVVSDGTARVTGTLSFQELTNPSFDLAAELERFRFQGIEGETGAATWGTIELRGSLQQPVLTGDIRAADGAVSLAPFQQPALNTRLAGTGALTMAGMGPDFDLAQTDAAGGLVVRDLEVRVGDDVWFLTEEARALLSGDLVLGSSGNDVTIQGTLQGERGTFQLQAGPITRQFQIIAAEIRFFGSPSPNPRIDVTASRVVRTLDRGEVDVHVRVTGTLENPTLSLGTEDGGSIPESELMSFLLFGHSTSDLSQLGQEQGVGGLFTQGLAYTGITELFGAMLAEESPVIDYFRIEPSVTGMGLVATAGTDLGSGLFASVDFPVGDASSAVAFRLDWRISRQWSVQLAREPVDPFRGAGRLPFSTDFEAAKQWLIASRWRWTY